MYCGYEGDIEREHVIPAHWYSHRTYDFNSQWIVDSCKQCNSFAGAFVSFSIPEKAAHILKRYKTKFRKILKVPLWTEEELNGVSPRLRLGIEESQLARVIVSRRIEHLKHVSEMSPDHLRPKWVEEDLRAMEKEYRRLKKSLKRKKKS